MSNPRISYEDFLEMVQEAESSEELRRVFQESLNNLTPEQREETEKALDELYEACRDFWEAQS